MEKRFKLRIYRVITTTLQSCRSKDPSNLPQDPVPSFSRLSSENNPPKSSSTVHLPPPRDVQTNRPSFKHHVSSALLSIGCGLPHTDEPSNDDLTGSHPPEFAWQEEDKWHVVAKIYEPRRKLYNSSDEDLTFAQPQPATAVTRNRRVAKNKKKKKNVPSRIRISTSSADSGCFSSDGGAAADEEETETLVSSSISCLSADSSSEHLPPIRESQPFPPILPHRRSANKRRSTNNHCQRRGGAEKSNSSKPPEDEDVPARLSVFQKLIPCTVDGKVKESFAIVKRSSDPYQDFKNSMMDMIVEKQMFEATDLEQLLQCFLSLNSRHYHGVIVEAFSEIWEALFRPSRAEGSKN